MPHFNLINATSSSIPLSQLKIRYWYTIDGVKAQDFHVDWSPAPSGTITGTFVQLATPRTGADFYLETGFTTGAGSLAPSGSLEMQLRFNKVDWTNYNENDDYSYDPRRTFYSDWRHVTVYRNGQLIWGTEP